MYPWDSATFVSTHNDVNPTNLLYDGNRLWLIDWESAKRNDPFIDIAQVCVALATTAELEELVLRRVLSSPPDDLVRARLLLAKQLVRLFTGAALVLVTSGPPEPVDLDAAMTMDEINAAVGRGHLAAGQPPPSEPSAPRSSGGRTMDALRRPEPGLSPSSARANQAVMKCQLGSGEPAGSPLADPHLPEWDTPAIAGARVPIGSKRVPIGTSGACPDARSVALTPERRVPRAR